MKKDKKFFIYTSLAVLETLILIYFSFQPAVIVVEPGIPRTGDIEHFTAYFIYGFLLQGSSRYFLSKNKTILFSLITGCLIGGLSETIQHFVPGRIADILDWIVDSIGSLCGAYLSSEFKKKL